MMHNLNRRLLATLCLLAAVNSPVAAQGQNPFMAATATSTPATIDICSRTDEVEAALLAALSLNPDDCAAVPAASLAGIDALNFWDNGIAALRTGDFDNLAALRSLNLSANPLTTLPSGIFDNLAALESLSLEINQLTTLPSNIFDNLAALISLSLGSNPLTTLPSGIFDNLAALNNLSLNGNPLLTTLPSGIFDNLAVLQGLDLISNSLTTLPPGIFDNLSAERQSLDLNLSRNQLDGLTYGHPLFDKLWRFPSRVSTGFRLTLDGQSRPPTPPPCQPAGGFPAEGEAECQAAEPEPEPEPEPPIAPEPDPPAEPDPEPDPSPEPPADGDLAGRIAALERKLAALEQQAALDADESREADAALQRGIDDAATERRSMGERLDAIEANMPPYRLQLWLPAPEE